MNQELSVRQSFSQWVEKQTQTRREIIFPVPVSTAQHHLKIAFASSINISNGFLLAGYKYTGEVNDMEINVQFTVRTRGRVNYVMQGKFFSHPKGSHLVMIIKVKTPFLFFAPPLALIFFSLYEQRIGFIIFAVLFLLICFPVMRWHLNSAANSVSSLVNKIVATTPSTFIIS